MKSQIKHVFGAFIFVLMSFNANARMIKDTPIGEIPFAVAGDSRIYVTAFVNGSDSLRFLVDTGASSLVLNTNSPKLKGFIHDGEVADNLGTSCENPYSTATTILSKSVL